MSKFYSNKENSNYLMISRFQIYMLISSDIPEYALKSIEELLVAVRKYEKENKCSHLDMIAVEKSTPISNFLLYGKPCIKNDDLYVDYKKVVNALNIAIFEDNPIAKQILPLFKNQVSGEKNILIKQYDAKTINYILENNDFNYYLSKINGTYTPLEYVVYHNNECVKMKLAENSKILTLNKK
ncbi:MAG: hypothetical protein E7166_05580 [Firmicutes bacterium]|nr:hypothetical protein [Bacillota bacterium]